MKASLKRIEATLKDLGKKKKSPETEPTAKNHNKNSFSFTISSEQNQNITEPAEDLAESIFGESSATESEDNVTHNNCVEKFSTSEFDYSTPNLPKYKPPQFTNHRNGANPALASNLLKEISAIAESWQSELKMLIRQIQDIYIEGSIINGWLESDITSSPTEASKKTTEEDPEKKKGTATLRHGEVHQLMDYIEEICATQEKATSKVTNKASRTGYRLCGLDNSGKVWSRPCPQEEIPRVSMGIARYHKLRQLLGRKQYLENRLNNLAETLVILHGHIKSDATAKNSTPIHQKQESRIEKKLTK
ncbi:MAG: hypothetical protein AAF378_15630 [Cyanobacteria bacterium P01_A01_bin.84]